MQELGFMCMIALEEVVPIMGHQLERAFSFVAPRSSLSLGDRDPGDCEQAFVAEIDNQVIAVAMIDGPIPQPEYDVAVKQSLFWPEAGETMAAHGAFLVLSGAERQKNHGLARAQAVAMTKLAAALAEITPSLGVYWGGAEAAVPPSRLAEATAEIAKGKWPVDIWLGYVMFGRDSAVQPFVGLQTRGAAPYLGFELEIEPYAVAEKMEPIRIVFNAIAYLMNYGDVIRDGQLVEVTGERRTSYRLHLGGAGRPGIARLSVLDVDHRKMN